MNLEHPAAGVLHFKADTQYDIASMFMRMQEFYESNLPGIRGKFFTIEQYMDAYANHFGNFTYTTDWSGFNVPGNVVDKFFTVFYKDLTHKEEALRKEILSNKSDGDRYYVIGTYKYETVDHELAHAFYYLDPNYHDEMLSLVRSIPTKTKQLMTDVLIKSGYCREVVEDEIQAYLSTDGMLELSKFFNTENLPWKNILRIKQTFVDMKEEQNGSFIVSE